MLPLGSMTKVSLLPAAPMRLEKPLKEMPATEPEPGPVIVHVTAGSSGPWSVSAPLPVMAVTPAPLVEAEPAAQEYEMAPALLIVQSPAGGARAPPDPPVADVPASAPAAVPEEE